VVRHALVQKIVTAYDSFDKLKADREREKTAVPAHQVEAASSS